MENIEYQNMFAVEDGHWWYKSLHNLILYFIKEYSRENSIRNILDAGCGTGRLIQLIRKELNIEAEGIDYKEEAINFCKKRNCLKIKQDSLNTVNLQNDYYDIITSIDVLYHNNIENEEKVLSKFYNALKPNGILILNLPAFEFLKSTHDIFIHTKKRYTITDIAQALKHTDFKIDFISYRLFFLFFPVVIFRFIKKIFFKQQVKHSDVEQMNKISNLLLYNLMNIENFLLKKKIKLPFGISVFAVARKI